MPRPCWRTSSATSVLPALLQLHQAAAVAAGEAREILDEQNVIPVGHQAAAHLLIALALLKGVAGAVAVLKEGEAAARKALLHKVADDGLLVFDGDVIPVQLIVHGNAGVTCDVEGFDHGGLPPFVGCHLRLGMLGTVRTGAGECALPLWGCLLSMGVFECCCYRIRNCFLQITLYTILWGIASLLEVECKSFGRRMRRFFFFDFFIAYGLGAAGLALFSRRVSSSATRFLL